MTLKLLGISLNRSGGAFNKILTMSVIVPEFEYPKVVAFSRV
jgi:hypothetical protein